MSKKHLIFFISFITPLFVAAQQPILPNKQSTSAINNIPLSKALPQPAHGNAPLNKTASSSNKKSRTPTHRRPTVTAYGNEWVTYSQKYYKIAVSKDGLCRIYPSTLANTGIPISSIDSRNYQLFFRGQQQYIYVQCKNTYLNAANGDYIEFYGQHNDGSLDSSLYYNTKFTPNPYFSLFNDTSSYYLTWNASVANNRMVKQTDTSFSSYGSAAPYVITSAVIAGSSYPATPPNSFSTVVTLQNIEYSAGATVTDGTYTPNDPRFTQNTAWVCGWVINNSGETYYPNVNNVYTGGSAPNAFIRTVILGEESGPCTFNISATGAGTLLNNFSFNGFAALDTSFTFPASDVANNGFNINYYNNAITNTNLIAPTYIYLSYPHTTNLGGATTFIMSVPDNGSSSKAYLDFTGFTNSNDSVRMYDLTNHNRFWVKPEFGGFNVVVPNSGGLKQCYLTSDAVIDTIKKLVPVGINRDGVFTNFTSGPSNAYLIIASPLLWSSAQAYAAYRQSNQYNKFNTVVADVYELYDQFGYGIDYSPLGLRRFCNYAIDKWTSPPSNLFFIGKGVHSYNFRYDTTTATHSEALVPSYGYPSSDILFTNGLGGDTLLEPAIPTGRLAALSNNDVNTYLSKVETYESTPAALWMKNVAHFAGGSAAQQENIFAAYLQNFANVIAGPLFGANVYLFQKYTPAPILGTVTDSITNLINNGVSLMTFFGHADGTNWDESIDFPSDYANYGKYPFIIANACFSGDIYAPLGETESTVSEQFVLESPGSIGFLASDYLGNPQFLDAYTQQIYNDLSSGPLYRHSMGSIIQNSIEVNQRGNNTFMNYTCLEMTLHGDPAIAINAKDSLPDYAVTNQSIYFSPPNVSILLDSFKVHVIVSNYAEALNQPVSGILTRTFPNGTSIPYVFSFNHIYFQDTVTITIPVSQTIGTGLNYFTASVDFTPNVYHELTLSNNNISSPGIPLLISSEDITPVWPYDYAIIPKDTVTLKASTDDPFASQRTYIFEIDTSHSFNSPLFKSEIITNSGGVIKASPYDAWGNTHYNGAVKGKAPEKITAKGVVKGTKNIVSTKNIANEKTEGERTTFTNNTLSTEKQNASINNKQVTIEGKHFNQSKEAQKNDKSLTQYHINRGPVRDSFINGAVYYWKVRRDTADSILYPWQMSSFQYIKNQNGWGQSNFFQFDNDEQFNDDNTFINFNKNQRNWTYNVNGHTLECYTFGSPGVNVSELYGTEYKIDNYVQSEAGCQLVEGIYVAIIDPTTLVPWTTANYNFGEYNGPGNNSCAYPDAKFIFLDNDASETQALINMLNTVPNGYYILAYSWIEGEFKAPALDNDSLVVAAFQNLGASQMPMHRTIPGLDSVPWIFFVQKGNPASAIQKYGANPTDSVQLSAVMSSNDSYGAITSSLIGPAAKYDSISWFQHSADRPPLTDSTRLNIVGVQPDGNTKTLINDITPTVANLYISSINPVLFPYIQLLLYTKDAINHSPAQMNYWRVFYQPVPEIAMNPNIYTYYHADTLSYGDMLSFQTVVQNISDWPIDSTLLLTWTTNQQNNIVYLKNKYVKHLNPGDTAKISLLVLDTNKSANALRSVWFEINPENYPFTRPEEYHFNDYADKSFYSYGDRINPVLDVTFNGVHILNNDIVSPQPSILMTFMDENKFLALNNPKNFQVYIRNITNPTPIPIPIGPLLSFTPAVLPQNKCSLLYTPTLTDGTYELSVQGTDISSNPTANNNYKIDFQVITKSAISEVLNYPNPFSTSTRFVFILTGEQIPTVFKIQIMTVTGKIVKEITEDEIGPIHIGRNITQYAWDGTDQYGSKLANGVYLYRVVTSINGQGINDYQTAADQYFTKGWGKMYLMR